MKRLGIVAALLTIVLALPSPALAQVKGVYWTTSGFFGPFDLKDTLLPSLPREKSRNPRHRIGSAKAKNGSSPPPLGCESPFFSPSGGGPLATPASG